MELTKVIIDLITPVQTFITRREKIPVRGK
jgi:hypothetical protein